MTIRSYTLPTKPIIRFIQSHSKSLTAFVYTDGIIEVHPTKPSTGPPLRIDDEPNFLLLLDIPSSPSLLPNNNSIVPITTFVITFHIQPKERVVGSFEVRAYEFLPNLNNNLNNFDSSGIKCGIVPIMLQIGEERLIKDFKSSSKNKLMASVMSCPKYVTGYGQRVLMLYKEECLGIIIIKKILSGKVCGCFNRENEFIKKKEEKKNIIESSIQNPRLGCLGGCGHLSLLPLNTKFGDNCEFDVNVKILGNVERGNILSKRKGLNIVFLQQQRQLSSTQKKKNNILMVNWINTSLDNLPSSNSSNGKNNSTFYIVTIDKEGIKLLSDLNNIATSLLSMVIQNDNEKNEIESASSLLLFSVPCYLLRSVLVANNHIIDMCSQDSDILLVAGNKETWLYLVDHD
ncbi:8943_t:CDS:2 [Diversispora eburnea]|uniref:8943_t:CDS:1 n=1 Tax=Diversispora eburnea TaxID=1213867 RepID=A0A9N9G2H5_9GLOM|nr:8943_t:CDS:2 [Diversispora eburnea]